MQGGRFAVCALSTLAACGDTLARPLESAPAGVAIEAGVADAGDVVRPCVTDQPLILVTTTPSNVSRPGAIDSAAPIDQYAPRPIGVRLTTLAGAPVGGCDVAWTPASGSGWVFPIARSTDADGRADAWWTAGPDAAQTVSVAVMDGQGGGSTVTIAGSTEPRRTRATRVYLEYPADAFDSYSVEVIPDLAPADARFGAVWTQSCGVGIDIDASGDGGAPTPRAFAFCWDSQAGATTVLDAAGGSCSPIADPGGARGTSCAQPYAWSLGQAYRFDLETSHVVAGHTDYAFYVTPVATGVRTRVVALRFAGEDQPRAAFSYLQDDAMGATCLETGQHAARFRNVKKIDGGVTSDVRTATFTRDYDVNANVICANYAYGISDDAFFLSTGAERVGPPLAPGSPPPTLNLP
jgi:hypothetical protein